MNSEVTGGDDDAETDTNRPASYFRRPTLRQIKRRVVSRKYTSDVRERLENETRLPDDESVTLAGFVLVEWFTPSNIVRLYETLRDLPDMTARSTSEWIDRLAQSREGTRTSWYWSSLGGVRHPGKFLLNGHHDPTLPEGVDVVWLKLYFITPSLTMLSATFTMTEEVGDLSPLLRVDYPPQIYDLVLHVKGPLSRFRSLLPWTRPKKYSLWHRERRASEHRRKESQDQIEYFESACRRWLKNKFPGGLNLPLQELPVARILLTEKEVPFGRERYWEPAGLSSWPEVWSASGGGWKVRFDHGREDRLIATYGARRQDVATSPGGGDSGDTCWYIVQSFNDEHLSTAVRWMVLSLVEFYTRRLATLRDRAATRRRFSKPVRLAVTLDDYLMSYGFDASAITHELLRESKDIRSFQFDTASYEEDLGWLPAGNRRDPMKLIPTLRKRMRSEAAALSESSRSTVEVIQASAALRQAIANTRLQRILLVLAVLALVVSVVSALVAFSALVV